MQHDDGVHALAPAGIGDADDGALGHGRVIATRCLGVSDGLASDVRHIAEASGVGVALDRVPVAVGVARATGDDGVAAALGGGEDYELLFAAPDPGRVEDAFSAAGLTRPLAIGRCTADAGERRLADGDLPEGGWEHTW